MKLWHVFVRAMINKPYNQLSFMLCERPTIIC